MLTVAWPTARSIGYTDLLPESLFVSVGAFSAVRHQVRYPNGRRTSPAFCDLVVRTRTAVLDYRPYAELNGRYDWVLGEMKLHFIDSHRDTLDAVTWRAIGRPSFETYKVRFKQEQDHDEPEIDELSSLEGKRKLRVHLRAERDRALAIKKKELVLRKSGCLRCEVCEFDFSASYRDTKLPFAEVHHTNPLGGGIERRTRLSDLAILCSNCHRMIHRTEPMLDVPSFKRRCLTTRSTPDPLRQAL
jgi:HNH endonuclease